MRTMRKSYQRNSSVNEKKNMIELKVDEQSYQLTVSREEEMRATADSIERMFERLNETRWYQWIRRIELKTLLFNSASHLVYTIKYWKK